MNLSRQAWLCIQTFVFLSLTLNHAMADDLPALQVRRGASPAIIDDQQRTVLLRGVNLNSLGDYYQANADAPTVIPSNEADFEAMARLGFNVVRLILSWSALEPERGVIDEAYLARIKTFVGYAKQQGLYTVLDMHQDAWGKYIASDGSEQCGFFQPSIGWDGAPQWATLTEGTSTCRFPGIRETSPAVARAFENFWRNRDGIEDELISVWARLATEFAAEPAIAGYDLLNEPNFGESVGFSQTLLMGNYYTKALRAIRKAEKKVNGGFQHVAFFEPSVEWSALGVTLWPIGWFVFDNNVVFAPHLYAGSITITGSVSSGYQQAKKVADFYLSPMWSGEWGWFGEPTQSESGIWEYAQHEDAYRIGGAVWQWKQACGDPHAQQVWNGQEVTGEQYHVNITLCPGDIPLGISPAYQTVLSRARPLYSPGELVSLKSDPYVGLLQISGKTDNKGELLIWVPASDRVPQPVVQGGSLLDIMEKPGGYHVSIEVGGAYDVTVDY